MTGPTDRPPLPTAFVERMGAGRPTRLTQETHDAIVSAVEQGSYLKIAAQAAGIGQSTLALWLARGRAAAAAREQHDPDALYCPECDRDRTGEARRVAEVNEREEERARVTGNTGYAHAVLDHCPTCRTDEYPHPWTVPADEARYLGLLEEVTRAQAVAEVAAVAAWRKAFGDDWRAARDYLARTSPERWAGVTRVQMTTEEAERRIDDAVNEALIAVGIDLPTGDPLDDYLDEGGDP